MESEKAFKINEIFVRLTSWCLKFPVNSDVKCNHSIGFSFFACIL